MGRGHHTDFMSHQCTPQSSTMHEIAKAQAVGPTDVVVNRLRTENGVPVGNRRERRMAERALRQLRKQSN